MWFCTVFVRGVWGWGAEALQRGFYMREHPLDTLGVVCRAYVIPQAHQYATTPCPVIMLDLGEGDTQRPSNLATISATYMGK